MPSEPVPVRRFTDEVEKLETVIGPHTLLKGTLETETNVEIRGTVEGDCKSGGLLWVRPGASVTGDLIATDFVLEGEVRGKIKAERRVELRAGSSVQGDVEAGSVAIAEGSFYKGEVKMTGAGTRQSVTFQEKRKPASDKPDKSS